MKRFFLFVVSLLLLLPVGAAKPKKTIKVACVGNSVTYGYRLPDRATQAYPVRLQQMLGDGYDVRNFGHSGATLLFRGHNPYVKLPEFRDAVNFKADIVVIHLGLNDTDPRNWPDHKEEFIPNYRALIDSFKVANPDARILICLMTPIFHGHPRFDSGTRDWHAQIQKDIRRVALGAGVQLIDLHTPLYNHPEMFPDALHPDPDGAFILAQTVYGALTGKFGGLSLSPLYADGMVLQRDEPLVFRGSADAGEQVRVAFHGNVTHATAGIDGRWEAVLAPEREGGPYELTVQTKSCAYRFQDVWVGDVWLCSGQSNMELRVDQTNSMQQDMADAARLPQLHLFNMPALTRTDNVVWDSLTLAANNRLEHLRMGPWQKCSPEAVKEFSGVAFNFGRVLAENLEGVHIGIICNAVGGTPTEAWIDRATMENEMPQMLTNWLDNDHTQAWVRGRARQNNRAAANPLQRHPYEPCYMFEAGIMPLDRYAVKGIVWYQGESNADRPEIHDDLFIMLENSWRDYWQRQLPFYFVQLSSLNRGHFPTFRNAQRLLADRLSDTWMAVSSDVGDSLDVHPRNKRPVGERLAAQALHHTYMKQIVSEGPRPLTAHAVAGGAIVVNFGNADGMTCTRGFEIAGTDGLYYPAKVRVEERAVRLTAPQVERPVSVRYAWQPFTRADLRNRQGFPASTFQMEVEEEY